MARAWLSDQQGDPPDQSPGALENRRRTTLVPGHQSTGHENGAAFLFLENVGRRDVRRLQKTWLRLGKYDVASLLALIAFDLGSGCTLCLAYFCRWSYHSRWLAPFGRPG